MLINKKHVSNMKIKKKIKKNRMQVSAQDSNRKSQHKIAI